MDHVPAFTNRQQKSDKNHETNNERIWHWDPEIHVCIVYSDSPMCFCMSHFYFTPALIKQWPHSKHMEYKSIYMWPKEPLNLHACWMMGSSKHRSKTHLGCIKITTFRGDLGHIWSHSYNLSGPIWWITCSPNVPPVSNMNFLTGSENKSSNI